MISACSRTGAPPPPPPQGEGAPPEETSPKGYRKIAWLMNEPGADERFAKVARQLRGFEVTMAEIGYRYGELYWAGRDRNWQYAAYQAKKIQTALARGVERRPKRARSAQVLGGALPQLEEAIAASDAALFDERFRVLTQSCNACHQSENKPFIAVAPPAERHSPVHAPAPAAAPPADR